MDNQIFLWINSFAGLYPWLDALGKFLAVYGIYIMAAWALLLWSNKKLRHHVYLAVVSSFISRVLIVEAIKIIVNRPRPFENLPVHLLLQDSGTGMAFSSGHAVILFAIAFSFYKTRWFWPFIIFATLSSIARIFVGVHYPSDILASIVIAWLTVWGLARLFKKRILS